MLWCLVSGTTLPFTLLQWPRYNRTPRSANTSFQLIYNKQLNKCAFMITWVKKKLPSARSPVCQASRWLWMLNSYNCWHQTISTLHQYRADVRQRCVILLWHTNLISHTRATFSTIKLLQPWEKNTQSECLSIQVNDCFDIWYLRKCFAQIQLSILRR
jgi:hypothetical protein